MHVKANERDYNLNKLLGTITCEECDIDNLFDPWRTPSEYKKAIAIDLGVQFQQFIEIVRPWECRKITGQVEV